MGECGTRVRYVSNGKLCRDSGVGIRGHRDLGGGTEGVGITGTLSLWP